MKVCGIDVNQPITYRHSSLRFFEKNEHHVERLCTDDVLLLVYQGTLRFSENGVATEVSAGEYYIQQQNSYQTGERASDSPQYLYVHFSGVWCEGNATLHRRGTFDYAQLKPLMERLDHYSHNRATLLERTVVFTEILTSLYHKQRPRTPAREMADFLATHVCEPMSLDRLAAEFNFSKNHVIHLFKQELGKTPIEYVNTLRLQKAMQWLESTSETAETIAERCGFHYYSHFYRLFLRQTGISPTEWRRRQQLNPS